METNILIELIVLGLITASIINCQKRIRQGVSWAYHISIILSLLLMTFSTFILIAFYKAAEGNCNYLDVSAFVLWGSVFIAAAINLVLTKKIEITPTDVIVHPLIGHKKNHSFCKALYYTILNKYDRHYAWKELTICFKTNKVHISSFQHKDFVAIHNQLLLHSIPENKTFTQEQPAHK
ncbi:MAG TPA: hypothetical protein VK796_02940 [Cytophaga sp.]|nr:hypothetical protein [Cytophaga sp.]